MADLEINPWVKDLIDCKERFVFCRGGAGSGKSMGAHQKIILRLTTEPGHRFLCLRKIATTVKKSIFLTFKDIIYEAGISSQFKFHETDKDITHLPTGNMIWCTGLDDREKIKSIKGVTSILMEEATEFDEGDLNQLNLRLRGITPNYKQIIILFNPIDTEHWIRKRIESTKCKEFFTTYLDNYFLDQEYIDQLNNEVAKDKYLYTVYVLGHWGTPRTGGEFYKKFDLGVNVGAVDFKPEKPLHISFDFNVLPYMTLTLYQIDEKDVYQVDEICAEPPYNSTKGICKLFKDKYAADDSAGLFVYGDPSGKHRDTRTEHGYNDFDIINNELHQYKPHSRVQSAAPPVALRGQWINEIFSGSQAVKVVVDKMCGKSVDDFLHLKENAEGGKLKERVKSESGAFVEKYGHTSDSFDYFITSAFRSDFQQFRTGNRKIKISVKHQRDSAKRY